MITYKQPGGGGYGFDTGLGSQCDPVLETTDVNAYYGLGPEAATAPTPGSGHARSIFDPYQDDAQLKGAAMKGFGLVYNPARITKRVNDSLGPWLDDNYHMPDDHSPRPDGELGAVSVPTDLDPQAGGCYGPVKWGWIDVPDGGDGLGRAASFGIARLGTARLGRALGNTAAAVDQLTAANNRAFWLSVVSTSAVVVLASANIFRLWKERKRPGVSGARRR